MRVQLSDAECRAWIEWGEAQGFSLEKHKQSNFIAHRDNGRIAIESEDVASALFERLRPIVPAYLDGRPARGCNSNIRLYRYGQGQRFGKHIDQSNFLDGDTGVTEFTVLVYLSGQVRGGETIFYKVIGNRCAFHRSLCLQACARAQHRKRIDIANGCCASCDGLEALQDHKGEYEAARFSPRAGSALIHAHGQRCLTHEGAEVVEGLKYLLRSDVYYSMDR